MTLDDPLPPPDVIEEMMKHCRCCECCRNPPCDGVMAGGMCDEQSCRDEEEFIDDREDESMPEDEQA